MQWFCWLWIVVLIRFEDLCHTESKVSVSNPINVSYRWGLCILVMCSYLCHCWCFLLYLFCSCCQISVLVVWLVHAGMNSIAVFGIIHLRLCVCWCQVKIGNTVLFFKLTVSWNKIQFIKKRENHKFFRKIWSVLIHKIWKFQQILAI